MEADTAVRHDENSSGRLGSRWLASALIAAVLLAGLLLMSVVYSARLVTEQQRTTCYLRLMWLEGDPDHASLVERPTASRLCDGPSPTFQYERESDEGPVPERVG